MVNSYSLECVILKRSNIGDADKLLTVFSKKYGKIKVIGKGIRKIKSRRAPHLELFNRSILSLHKGKNFDIVTEAQSIQTYETLKKDIVKVQTAYFLVELIDKLCPELVEHDDAYHALIRALITLNEEEVSRTHSNIADNFGNNLLHFLGFLPYDKTLAGNALIDFIEGLIEGNLKTVNILTRTT